MKRVGLIIGLLITLTAIVTASLYFVHRIRIKQQCGRIASGQAEKTGLNGFSKSESYDLYYSDCTAAQ